MILWLFFIYFVGKAFYTLAEKHHKSKWLYAVLGVLSYYGAILLAGVMIGIVLVLFNPALVDSLSDTTVALIALPLGILACWGFYRFLKYRWEKPTAVSPQAPLDSGFTTDIPHEPV